MRFYDEMTPIAVVIVNHNTCQHLRACLASIEPGTAREVIVVDNASSDGSVEMVQAAYPWVRLYANRTNPGYGAAANQALAEATAPYVLLLNSDTLLESGALEALSQYLDQHPRAGIVGPRLVNPDGSLQASCYPFPGTLRWLLDNDMMSQWIRYIPVFRNCFLRTWSHTHARIVPAVKGAALAIRREAFEAVDGFNKAYFLFFEELDICFRLIRAGWQIHFTPVTKVVHAGGASTLQYHHEMAVQFFAGLMQFLQYHYSGIRLAGLVTIVKSIELARCIRKVVQLQITHDASKRTTIKEDILARKRMLLGHWRR